MTHLDSIISFNVPKSIYPVSEAVDVVLHNDVGRSKSYRALSTQWVIYGVQRRRPDLDNHY
jgi:hypothetical protein